MLMMILALQTISGPPVPADMHVVRPCPPANDSGDIVVCDRGDRSPRLERLPDRPAKASPEEAMSFRLPGGGKGRVHAIQSSVGGFTGQGAAVTLTKFFRKKNAEE